jgi:phosphoribosylglycinamide formyltransferase-1
LTSAGRLPIVVLISGEGTNLQALIDAQHAGRLDIDIRAVLSDKRSAKGLERAVAAGIAAEHVDPRAHADRAAFDAALADAIERHAPGLVVLAGFMRILSPSFIARFNDRTLNIHPSLLPKYKGLDTHRRALAARERAHGATVHFVTTELDSGPSILQYRIEIRPSDTEQTLSARVHQGEYIILGRAVEWFAAGRLKLEDGVAMLDRRPLQTPVVIEDD